MKDKHSDNSAYFVAAESKFLQFLLTSKGLGPMLQKYILRRAMKQYPEWSYSAPTVTVAEGGAFDHPYPARKPFTVSAVNDTQEIWENGIKQMADFKFCHVGSLVPNVYERYARICHPGLRREGQLLLPVFWTDMATFTGAHAHALMHWGKICTSRFYGEEVEEPVVGTIPDTILEPLKKVLLLFASDEPCWLAVWEGWGDDYLPQVPETASVKTKERGWDLFRVPFESIDAQLLIGGEQTASMVWSGDFSWWLNNDVDLNSTYIGGSGELIDALLDCEDLEVWEVKPEDGVSLDSDTMN